MLTLDQVEVDNATVAMCAAAQLPMEALEDKRYRHQVIAFVLALSKNYEREQTYDGLWEKYGLKTCASNAQSKAIRMEHHAGRLGLSDEEYDAVMAHDDAMDDALDLINYGAFCARLIDKSARENGLVSTNGN